MPDVVSAYEASQTLECSSAIEIVVAPAAEGEMNTVSSAAGAVDVLRANGYAPIDVQFAAPAFDPRYKNRRAEIWFAMSESIKRGGALPNMPELVGELTTPTYTFVGGKFQLEDKDQVKRRLGRSPDLADALALTFGMPDMPAALASGMERQGVGKALADFDPYDDRALEQR